MQLFN